jgi:hypothetical protein
MVISAHAQLPLTPKPGSERCSGFISPLFINQHNPRPTEMMQQREMRMMQVIAPPALLDEALLEKCSNWKQALAVSMGLARGQIADSCLADDLGVLPCVWSRIKNQPKNRPAYLSPDAYPALYAHLGNVGVLQWMALKAGFSLVPRAETRAQRLRRELAELERSEAA